MENSNVIDLEDIDTRKNIGRPRLTEEEKAKKAKIKNELLLIRKAISPLIDIGLNREQILTLLLEGKEHLLQYQEKINELITESFNTIEEKDEKKYDAIEFKDFKFNKKGEITGFKSTAENFEAIIDYMKIQYKYNVVSHDIDIYENGEIKEDKSIYKGLIYSVAQRNDCQIKPQDIGMFATTIAMKNKYNPWQDYIEKCLKKHSKVEELKQYNTIKELFRALVLRNNYDKDFAFVLFKKFLMHFIASYKIMDYGCNGVFILQGQQNLGKTAFFENIVPNHFFKSGMSVNPENDDSVRKVLKYMLVELGEIEGTLKADVNKLKNFITEKTFAFRKQYSDFIEENKRYTVLCGTCNSEEFLKDETGDRRYWVIPISSIDFNVLNSINIEKLWAEVYYLFEEEENKIPLVKGTRRNHAHELNRDESAKLININREDFTFKSTQQVKIENVFDWSKSERYYISSATLSLKVFNESILPAKIGGTLKSLNIEKVKKRLYGNPNPIWYYCVPPLLDKNLMSELNLINVEAENKKKSLIEKLGNEVESWD